MGSLRDIRSLTDKYRLGLGAESEHSGGSVHAFRCLGCGPFGGTVVLAISSPVVASWLCPGCVAIFLEPVWIKGGKGKDGGMG